MLLVCATLGPASVAQAQTTTTARATTTTIVCGSNAGERVSCAVNTQGGVTLVTTLGSTACDLGRTWGYDAKGIWVANGCRGEFTVPPPPATFGRYTPTAGFQVADTEAGDLNIKMFGYMRYLNQLALDPTYIDAFGITRTTQQRQDIQFNKLLIYFYGWIMSPKFRYLTYVWTSNVSLGQVSQVVVAGNLTYKFNDHATLGFGINSLPGVRSTEGNFPFWLTVDERPIADEYFRPSYTTGLFARGQVVEKLDYQLMWGNNLSQFGIDAAQLDNGLDTVSGALVWMPTTGEFGKNGAFGDFDEHDTLATRFGVHFSRSTETPQSQPNTNAFDNVQIRISNGGVVFAPDLFGPGLQIDEARYRMVAADGGLKYTGVSLDVEVYRRWIDDFSVRGTGAFRFSTLDDTGFQIQASAMAVPRLVQIYGGGSKIFGQYGDPYDIRTGVNVFPWKNQVVRWNAEGIYLSRSPVGGLNIPYSAGNTGFVFQSNLVLAF